MFRFSFNLSLAGRWIFGSEFYRNLIIIQFLRITVPYQLERKVIHKCFFIRILKKLELIEVKSSWNSWRSIYNKIPLFTYTRCVCVRWTVHSRAESVVCTLHCTVYYHGVYSVHCTRKYRQLQRRNVALLKHTLEGQPRMGFQTLFTPEMNVLINLGYFV